MKHLPEFVEKIQKNEKGKFHQSYGLSALRKEIEDRNCEISDEIKRT